MESNNIPFYVHFNVKERTIKSISPCMNKIDDVDVIEISHDLGLKFINGEELPSKWIIGRINGKDAIQRKEEISHVFRIETQPLIQLEKTNDHTDIQIKLGKSIKIYYDAEKLMEMVHPVKLYFTKEDDISYLKCALELSVNMLDKILQQNKLKRWPNPLVLDLEDCKDTSIYMIRNNLTAGIK